MALRFIDGFDYYTTDEEMVAKWGSATDSSSYYQVLPTGGRDGGGCVELYTNSGYLRKNLDDQTGWTVGFRLNMAFLPSSNTRILDFRDSAGDVQCSLAVSTTGTLMVYRGSSSLLASAPISLVPAAWNYIEISVVIHDSAGSVVVRIGEVEVINISGVDTKYTSIVGARAISILGGAFAVRFSYDDVYILDSTGTVNNTFLGDVRVDAIVPSAPGTHTDFTPVGGANNWDNVNDAVLDGDSTYNASSTVGATDTFAFSNLPVATGDIFGVQANLCARKDDAGAGTMKPVALIGSTIYEGPESSLSDSFTRLSGIWDTNPDTSAPWESSEVNAAEFGYRVAS